MIRAVHPASSALADHLIETGALTASTALADAFRRVDRGVFVPSFARYEHTPWGTRYRLVRQDDPDSREEWASHVYADRTLIIEVEDRPVAEALPQGTGTGRWTSSSTMPSLMARMLGELDLTGTPRVLEIGVGSGYNAAVLCELLGADNVTSIDISARLVADASARLARAGYRPVVAEYDGHRGYPDRAPYDRLVATAAFTHVPPAWVSQVLPEGVILVNLAGGTGGAMLKLRVHGDGTAQGRFLPRWAGFMPARSHTPRERVTVDDEGEHRETPLNPAHLRERPALAFVAQLATVDASTVLKTADDGTDFLFLEGADGAWAEIDMEPGDSGRFAVVEGGPRRLWQTVEEAYRWWEERGQPEWSSFGVTVTPDRQYAWYGSPDSGTSWRLPAV